MNLCQINIENHSTLGTRRQATGLQRIIENNLGLVLMVSHAVTENKRNPSNENKIRSTRFLDWPLLESECGSSVRLPLQNYLVSVLDSLSANNFHNV